MKFIKASIAVLALSAFSVSAFANDSGAPYVNVGVDMFNADLDDGTATAWALSGALGYMFSPYMGVEGQASIGVIDEEIDGVDFGLDSSFAGFGVLRMPTGGPVELFARGGYHFSQISASSGPVSVGLDTDGFAAGVGGEYFFAPSNAIRLEYTYYDLQVSEVAGQAVDESGNANSVKLSFVRLF